MTSFFWERGGGCLGFGAWGLGLGMGLSWSRVTKISVTEIIQVSV